MDLNNAPVFLDTAFLKSWLDEKDEFHSVAVNIAEKLLSTDKELFTSNFILDESYTLIRTRCGLSKAIDLKDKVSQSLKVVIDRVTQSDERIAWEWFENDLSKLSFTDCVSFAQMKRLGIETVATFDEHFRRAGFKVFAQT